MNNQIFISNLVVPITIGVPDWERAIPQSLFIDLNIILKKKDAFNSDNLEDTIDYGAVIELIKSLAETNEDTLLESFGEKIASKILQDYPAQSLTLKISKKKIITDADFVGIIINRSI
jgi:dihydroneopterin aldolase